MPRRGRITKRDVLPDPLYNSQLVTKLVNNIMYDGKKGVAQKIVYDAFAMIEQKSGENALDVFTAALENVMPVLEVKARRVGGSNYQVPMEVRPARRQTLGLRWITSYARNFTISAAQVNYYGPDEPGFIYADTDSIHCDLPVTSLKNVPVHDSNFCCWKIESVWDVALFARQKTYIEHAAGADPLDPKSYDIKCAGMPDNCKSLLAHSLTGTLPDNFDELPEDQQEFVKEKRELTDFTVGLAVPGKLMPKRIPGGIVLTDSIYEMR